MRNLAFIWDELLSSSIVLLVSIAGSSSLASFNICTGTKNAVWKRLLYVSLLCSQAKPGFRELNPAYN